MVEPRPFYSIAHKCNSVEHVRRSLELGANAIECDIRCQSLRSGFCVNHDTTLFRARDALQPYLEGVRRIAEEQPRLALMIFDCKLSQPEAALPLLECIREHLTSAVPLDILLTVASYDKQRQFFLPLKGKLGEHEGVGIDEDDDPPGVSRFFQELGFDNHSYANGIFPLGREPASAHTTMEAIALKALERKIKLVYMWTMMSPASIRNYICMGIDGIAVDDVALLSQVLQEPGCRELVRLAQRSDAPFSRAMPPAYVLEVKTGDGRMAGTNAMLRFVLEGSAGRLEVTLDASPERLFERGRTDMVTLMGQAIGQPRALTVWRDGSGLAPDWCLDYIIVRSSELDQPLCADFYCWIPAGEELRAPLRPLLERERG